MKNLILLTLLVLSKFTHADAITEACKRDVPNEMVNEFEREKPGVQRNNVRAAIAGVLPRAEYQVQTKTAVCIADKILLAMKDTANFAYYCPSVTSKLRIDCFNSWLKKQDTSYASQVAQFAATAYTLTELDMRSSPKKGAALVKLLDSLLLSLERYSTTKNVAFRFAQTDIKERMSLRENEMRDFMIVKADLLSRIEDDLRLLKVAIPARASAAVAKKVAAPKGFKKISMSAGELKAEFIRRQLMSRIAKLKKV